MINCPIKSDLGWKRIASEVGDAKANLAYFRNGDRIPTLDEARQILSTRGIVDLQSPNELLAALPSSGLSPQQQGLIKFFLDSPLSSAIQGIRIKIADTLQHGWQGSYFDGLVQVARASQPDTMVHEFSHRVWELLPDDVRNQFGVMRREAIAERLRQPMNYAQISQLEQLRDNPTSGGQEYMQRGYAKELYPFSSDEEFFTHSLSDSFQERMDNTRRGTWERVKQFFRDMVSAVKQFTGMSQTRQDLLNNIINGRFDLAGRIQAERPQAALAAEPEEEEKPETTQVMGETMEIGKREHISTDSKQASVDYTKSILDRAGVDAELQEIPNEEEPGKISRLWKFNTDFDLNAEGQKLVRLLREDDMRHKSGAQPLDLNGNLINSIRWNIQKGFLSKEIDGKPVMSLDIRRQLFGIAQSEASARGIALAALSVHNAPLHEVAHDPELHLVRQYYDMFGGDELTSFLTRLLRELGGLFSDDDLAKIAKEKPEQEKLINEILAKNSRDQGGRVYRIVQNLLKPRGKPRRAILEKNAKIQEAANNIIEQAKKQGITAPERKGRALTPIEKLLLLVKPENADKLNELIKQAVSDGERNAGIKVALRDALSTDEREELEARFAAGENPTEEQIAEGLELPEFAHWKVIRDNLLGYSPVTVKLAQELIKSDFKGAQFKKESASKPADLRINLFELAKNPEAEVRRVIDTYVKNIDASMEMKNATDETKQQIARLIREKVGEELQARRKEFLDNFFTVKNSVPKTASERLKQLINAGVSKDPRFQSDKVRQLIKRVANLYLKDDDFSSLATSTRAEKFNWLEQKYDEIFKAERFDQLDEPTREYLEAVIRTQLAERIQSGEEKLVRSFLKGSDVSFIKEPITPESREASLNAAKSKLEGLARAGAFDSATVESVAAKSALQKLLPSLTSLAKMILETPGLSQENYRSFIIDHLVDGLSIDPANADKIWAAFNEAYGIKIVEARKRALKIAIESLTPKEREVIPRTDGKLWKRIEHFFNAGGNQVSDLLKQVAALRGYNPPSDADVAAMKRLVEREQQLRELTKHQENVINSRHELDAKQKAKARADQKAKNEATTAYERGKLLQDISVRWAKMTKPFFKNLGKAGYEYATANMLTTLGFPVRLTEHIGSQLIVQTMTRPVGVAWHQYLEDRAAGRPTHVLQDAWNMLKGTLKNTGDALKQAVTNAKAEFTGNKDMTGKLDRLMGGVNILSRIEAEAAEQWNKGNKAQALLLYLAGLPKFGIRVVTALDALSATLIETQEVRNQVFTHMAGQGMPRYQIEINLDKIFNYIKEQRFSTRLEAKDILEQYGIKHTEKDLDEATEKLLRRKMWLRLRELDYPADSFEAYALRQKQAFAWQDPENVGLGGAITKAMMAARTFAQERGLPFLPLEFASAIGKSINYKLMMTPLYKWADSSADSQVKSAWFCTTMDRHVRQVQALAGTMAGALAAYLVLTGVMRVNLHWPSDKKKRQEWETEGRRPGTVDFMLPDGSFIPMSLLVGPMALLAPTIAGVGAAKNLMDEREMKQQQLDEMAKRTGLPPGKINPVSMSDIMGIAGESAWNTLFGGSAAAGMLGSYQEFQIPNVRKATAATISPFIPGLRAYQEISRMNGVYLDPKLASVFDYLVPLPTSQAREVNALGDPVRTSNDAQRIVGVLTAGSYPLPVQPAKNADHRDAPSNAAYSALAASGWFPTAINPNKGYNINGTYRPMNDAELEKFTVLRGTLFKQNLEQLGGSASKQQAQAAMQDATNQALQSIGATPPVSARGAGSHRSASPGRVGRSLMRKGMSSHRISIKRLRKPARGHIRLKAVHVRKPRLRTTKVRMHRPRIRKPRLTIQNANTD